MVNYQGNCVVCNKEINYRYNYCKECYQEEKKKGNYPQVRYNACEKCLGEDCVCCNFY